MLNRACFALKNFFSGAIFILLKRGDSRHGGRNWRPQWGRQQRGPTARSLAPRPPGRYITAETALVTGLLLILPSATEAQKQPPTLTVTTLISGLSIPWDLGFTPDGTMLFTERAGVIKVRLANGTVQQVTADLSDVSSFGEAGLMALVIDPGFSSNRKFYTCQATTSNVVEVVAWTINDTYSEATRVKDPLVGNIPAASRHSGCRLRFGPQDSLWIATGVPPPERYRKIGVPWAEKCSACKPLLGRAQPETPLQTIRSSTPTATGTFRG